MNRSAPSNKNNLNNLLGGLTAQEFLDKYWQKRPLFIPGALANFTSPLSPDELAGLPPAELPRLYLMDLHRAQLRHRVPLRWLVKDLSGLLYSGMFSAHDLPLTLRDYLRLVEAYCGTPWRQCLRQRRRLWERVLRRALRDARKEGRGTARLAQMLRLLAGA